MGDSQTCDSTWMLSTLGRQAAVARRLPIWDPVGKALFTYEAVVLKVEVMIAPCIGILNQTNNTLEESAGRRRSRDQRCNTIADLKEWVCKLEPKCALEKRGFVKHGSRRCISTAGVLVARASNGAVHDAVASNHVVGLNLPYHRRPLDPYWKHRIPARPVY